MRKTGRRRQEIGEGGKDYEMRRSKVAGSTSPLTKGKEEERAYSDSGKLPYNNRLVLLLESSHVLLAAVESPRWWAQDLARGWSLPGLHGTGLWQDADVADWQVFNSRFIPTFARCLSILVVSPFLHTGALHRPVPARRPCRLDQMHGPCLSRTWR